MPDYKIEYDFYTCCDECNEIIGISFVCPICKEHNALNCDMDIYGAKRFMGIKDQSFQCEDCNSKFRITDLDHSHINAEEVIIK